MVSYYHSPSHWTLPYTWIAWHNNIGHSIINYMYILYENIIYTWHTMKQFEIQPITEMGQCGETVNTSVLSVSMENYQSLLTGQCQCQSKFSSNELTWYLQWNTQLAHWGMLVCYTILCYTAPHYPNCTTLLYYATLTLWHCCPVLLLLLAPGHINAGI